MYKHSYFFFKALEDEGGDQENIQIPIPFEATSKKGGKTKGNLLVRKVSKATYFLPNDGFPNSFFCCVLFNLSGKKLDSDTDATGDEASFKVTMVKISLLYRPSVVI